MSQKSFLGHPKGLFLLFTTEMWERFSYYGMRAILVLYLVDRAQGLGWTESSALQLYGNFTMLVYFTPLIGGWLADNYLGQRKAILLGGALMAGGHFLLGTPHSWIPGNELLFFYAGLTGLVIGNGLFKPNISTMVGDLYPAGDNRRDGAFTIFYMGINLGAFIAPLVIGLVVEATNWQNGFIVAGIGMLLALVLQALLAPGYLGEIGRVPAAKLSAKTDAGKHEPLTKEEKDRIRVILILGVFVVIFWAGFEQAGGLMNIYTMHYADRSIGDFTIPTAWFQSLNPVFIMLLAPVVATIWVRMGSNEPSSPIKFAFALVFMALGFVFMVGAAMQQGGDPDVLISPWWIVAAFFCHTLGELCLSPIGMAMVTKLAPLRLASLMMGVWFTFNALANKVAGVVGALIGDGADSAANALNIFAGIAIT